MAAELVGLEYLRRNEIKNKSCDASRPYAFISYSHDPRDAQIVMNVFNVLYNKGYNLWIDIANMPHDENAWSDCAIGALRNKSCSFAFFFRSESSMSKETIAKELETIKRLRHVRRIVTVDIWHDEENTADRYYDELLNSDDDSAMKFKACERICNIVSMANSAIRLAADVQNDIPKLAEFMEEELLELGVLPLTHGDGLDSGVEATGIKRAQPQPLGAAAANGQEAPAETAQAPAPAGEETNPSGEGVIRTITLPDFMRQYGPNTFVKNTFHSVRLIGKGEYAKYNSGFYQSTYPLVWNFVEGLLKERGAAYIRFVNERNAGSKNPPFITAEEQRRRKAAGSNVAYRCLEVPGLENWAMCIHYGQYAWINDVLRKRMLELGLPLDGFSLEHTTGQAEKNKSTEITVPAGGIAGPEHLDGKGGKQRKRALEEGGYHITLFGEYCPGLSLKNMMLAVFKKTMGRHPDKLDLLLEDLPCLGEGIEIRRDAHPSTFRSGESVAIDGRSISIGTALGQSQVLNYIGRLMQICGEPKENLVISGYDY